MGSAASTVATVLGITLEDENDFQWLAIGSVGTLLIVVLVLLVVLLRRWRRMERRAERMEQLPAATADRLMVKRRAAGPPEWQRYGGPE